MLEQRTYRAQARWTLTKCVAGLISSVARLRPDSGDPAVRPVLLLMVPGCALRGKSAESASTGRLETKMECKHWLLISAFWLGAATLADAQTMISASRKIDWSKAGVVGGIPGSHDDLRDAESGA